MCGVKTCRGFLLFIFCDGPGEKAKKGLKKFYPAGGDRVERKASYRKHRKYLHKVHFRYHTMDKHIKA